MPKDSRVRSGTRRLMQTLRHATSFRLINDTIRGAPSLCDLVSNIDDLPEISRFFELLSAQVSYPDFRVPKVVQSTLHSVNFAFSERL